MVKVNVPEFSKTTNMEGKNTGAVSETASLCILLQRVAQEEPRTSKAHYLLCLAKALGLASTETQHRKQVRSWRLWSQAPV